MPEAPSAKRHPYEWKDAWEIQWNNAIGLPAKQSHLAIKAMKWLGTYDLEQYGWTSVWRVLLEYAATNDTISQREFLDLGLGWLERIAPTHPRWALMWLSLWDTAQGTLAFRDLLIRKGRDWLVATGTRTDWHLVWKELWKIPALRDNELEAAARFRSKKMSLHDRLAIERLLRQSELKYLL
ncbi:hypothetical protein JQ584_46405 [Bradyrhizobium liaoningense]|nr:hypothetical protein [Bradyrhizobium liaoningense]